MIDIRLLQNGDIVKETIVGGNVDITKYIADILNYQRLKLRPLLGTELYEKICLDYDADTLSGPYFELYHNHIKFLIIHGATELYLAHGAYMITNSGIVKHSSDDLQTVNKNEVDFLVQSSRKLYTMYETEFMKYMNVNGKLFPEWASKCATSKGRTVGGWRLR